MKAFALSILIGALGAAGLAPAAVAQNRTDNQLTIVASGGTFQDALSRHFYRRFEAATGVRVAHVPIETTEQFTRARAMSQAGRVEWDIVTAEPQTFFRDQALLERLDCSRLPNAGKFGVEGTCGEYGMFRTIGGGVITFSKTAFPNGGPKTWADFWDTKAFPGPRCLPGIVPHYVMMSALLADGVPNDKLFPLDIPRAVRKLQEIKPHVAVWYTSGNQSMDTLRKGECVTSWMWSGRAIQLMAEGQPLDITWNQSQPVIAYWAILKDAPNKDRAYQFLNFFMDAPASHATFSKEIFYDTSNREALKDMSADEMPLRAVSEPNLKAQVPVDWHWVAQNTDAVRVAFQDMLTR